MSAVFVIGLELCFYPRYWQIIELGKNTVKHSNKTRDAVNGDLTGLDADWQSQGLAVMCWHWTGENQHHSLLYSYLFLILISPMMFLFLLLCHLFSMNANTISPDCSQPQHIANLSSSELYLMFMEQIKMWKYCVTFYKQKHLRIRRLWTK